MYIDQKNKIFSKSAPIYSKNDKTSKPSAAHFHRNQSQNNKISKLERQLHAALVNAFDAGLKDGKKESETRITVSAADWSSYMK